jgi:hypothetical protein
MISKGHGLGVPQGSGNLPFDGFVGDSPLGYHDIPIFWDTGSIDFGVMGRKKKWLRQKNQINP